MKYLIWAVFISLFVVNLSSLLSAEVQSSEAEYPMSKIEKMNQSEDEWRKKLSCDEYNVLREKGTEAPFTGKYWDNKKKGMYRCAGCGLELFSSDTKFESGTGWPSFYAPVDDKHIAYKEDKSHFMVRTEILCARCGGLLGHVFDDGPTPTGKRFCVNSASLKFEDKKK